MTVLISTRKGCILTLAGMDGMLASDYGWIVRRKGYQYVSHWWTMGWETKLGVHGASCAGNLVAHKEHASTTLKHTALRIASFIAGHRIIRLLKKTLIFKDSSSTLRFERDVSVADGIVLVRDRITGIIGTDWIMRAPRSSKRHVASADSFHPEDLGILNGVERTEDMIHGHGTFECITRFRPMPRVREGGMSGADPLIPQQQSFKPQI